MRSGSFKDVIYKMCILILYIAKSAGAVEYIDCFSEEGQDPTPDECPGYDTKQSDGKVLVMLEL